MTAIIQNEGLKNKIAPSLIYGVTSAKEELLWAQAGVHELGDPDSQALTPDSVFWLCSQTKMVTSVRLNGL
jgi:hypothetical protein